jgi:hypothetical protein
LLERAAPDEVAIACNEVDRTISERVAELLEEIALVCARIPPVAALVDLMSVSDADSSVLRIQSCHRNCPTIMG